MRRMLFSDFGGDGNASRTTKSESPKPRSDGLRRSDFSRYSAHLYVRRIQSDYIIASSAACNNVRANTVVAGSIMQRGVARPIVQLQRLRCPRYRYREADELAHHGQFRMRQFNMMR